MKTHELAKALNMLAKILRASPNTELANFDPVRIKRSRSQDMPERTDLPAALMVMGALAKYRKADWTTVIQEFGLDIPVKKTDSVRDLMGRFMSYMARNPDELTKFSKKTNRQPEGYSAELSHALSILLGHRE